jgi:ankyrin repeat protein
MKRVIVIILVLVVVGVGFYFGYQYSGIRKSIFGDTSHIQTPPNQLAEVDKPDKDGTTTLMDAAFSGQTANVQYLIEKGAAVNAQNKFEMTPLIKAVSRPYSSGNSIEVVKLLINNGADINFKTKEGWTALQGAVQGEQTEAALYLIENGAEVDPKYTPNGQTPLMMTVQRHNKVLTEALIAKGANVNTRDNSGMSVLRQAQVRPELIELLKQAGAKE